MKLKITEIKVEMKYLPRIKLDLDTIERYKEAYEICEDLPPLVVQKENHILIDGFHRFEAQKRLGYENVEVILMDIPEDEIYVTSIKCNRRHGLPFSREDRDAQIRNLRFETTPPLTYEEIGKAVLLSTSQIGAICREMQFKINGAINTKVDLRDKLTPEETEEIQDRLDVGEPTSGVAKDYPVSAGRVSQLKKSPRIKKSRPSRQNRPLPTKLSIYHLKRRFTKLNPLADSQEIDWSSIDSELIYEEVVHDLSKEYPDYKWYPPEEGRYWALENMPLEIHENNVTIKLKLTWTNDAKYAHVKGTIPKKVLNYVRDRLYNESSIEWPLVEVENPDRRLFPELSDEDLTEKFEKTQEPVEEEDEEMKIYSELLPEK